MSYISNVNIIDGSLKDSNDALLCIGVYKDHSMTTNGSDIDQASGGAISSAIKVGDIKGKVGEVNYFYVNNCRLAIIGLGNKDEINFETVRLAAGSVLRSAISKKADSVTIDCFCSGLESCQAMGEGVVLGSYQFLDYKTKEKKKFEPRSVSVIGCNQQEIDKGVAIGSAVCFSRDLANHPGNKTTPTRLADAAKEIADVGEMSLTVFERKEFTQMGMGGLAGVAQGTDEPPKFIILEYNNGGNDKPKVLVGKGLTFDSGGISIKPASKMDEMKYDMCGAAAVLGIMKAVAGLKPNRNIVAAIAATENMPGGRASKPGDIVKAYNGKTIEILNTDAEGRLVLADALAYVSKHHDPKYMVNFATLTGAVIVALGHVASGVMGTDKKLVQSILKAGETSGERVWELPLWDDYCDDVKSKIADVKNLGASGQAGTIAGGAFLKAFVGETPWAHLDIAGTAWWDKDRPYVPPGPSGVAVRLSLELLNILR